MHIKNGSKTLRRVQDIYARHNFVRKKMMNGFFRKNELTKESF